MAKNDRGFYHLEDGDTDNTLPALVLAQYDTNGDVVADGAAGEASDVTNVDIIVLGWDSAKRFLVPVGTDKFEFEFTDALAT